MGSSPGSTYAEVNPDEVKQAYGIPPSDPLILFIGRLAYQKGPDILIEAVQTVFHDHPDAHLIMAGEGDMQQALGAQAEDLPVTFPG